MELQKYICWCSVKKNLVFDSNILTFFWVVQGTFPTKSVLLSFSASRFRACSLRWVLASSIISSKFFFLAFFAFLLFLCSRRAAPQKPKKHSQVKIFVFQKYNSPVSPSPLSSFAAFFLFFAKAFFECKHQMNIFVCALDKKNHF